MWVIKRDGKQVDFDESKIKNAITKANDSLEEGKGKITSSDIDFVTNEIIKRINKEFYDGAKKNVDYIEKDWDRIQIEDIQDLVQNTLIAQNYYELATAYISYRAERTRIRENRSDFISEIIGKANPSLDTIDNQNANVDEMSFGGRKGEADSVIMRKLALDSMSKEHAQNHIENRIYIHDLDSYYVGAHNCLSVPFDDIFKYGVDVRNTDIRPVRSLGTAFQIYAVGFQLQSLQQFGGVSATHIDTSSVPYFRISFNKHFKSIQNILPFVKVNQALDETKSIIDKQYTKGLINKYIHKKALELTKKELAQSAEGLYHNLNTLLSRSGNQLPFTSINYGLDTTLEGRLIIDALLEGCMKGVGKVHKTSIFPCGIFQYKKGINDRPGTPNYELKKKAISSTVKRFYPNYANNDWSVQVEGIKKDRKLKLKSLEALYNNDIKGYHVLCDILANEPEIARKLSILVEKCPQNTKKEPKNTNVTTSILDDDYPIHLSIDNDHVNEYETMSTMGCVHGSEMVTYKLNGRIYVDTFVRMWDHVIDKLGRQSCRPQPGMSDKRNRYVRFDDLQNVDLHIWDSHEKKFVLVKNMNKNVSKNFVDVTLRNGRIVTVTDDHVFTTQDNPYIYAKDLKVGMKIEIDHTQPTENYNNYDNLYAWMMGVIFCGLKRKHGGKISINIPYKFSDENKECFINALKVFFQLEDDEIKLNRIIAKHGDVMTEITIKNKTILFENEEYNDDRGTYCKTISNILIDHFNGIIETDREITYKWFSADDESKLYFFAGMIDSGVKFNDYGRMYFESHRRIAAEQIMLFIQACGIHARMKKIENYRSDDTITSKYEIDFSPIEKLINIVKCEKSSQMIKVSYNYTLPKYSEVVSVEPNYAVTSRGWDYSYDVSTESEHFTVSGVYSHNCRTYNGFDINFDEDYYTKLLYEVIKTKKLPLNFLYSAMQKDGRGNIAPNTIILPTIAMESKEESSRTGEDVVKIFMIRLNKAIHDAKNELIERYKHIAKQPVEAAKFMYRNNLMKGYIPEEGIESALKHGTLALGQIALAEALQILIGCDHTTEQGMELAKKIEELFKTNCNEFKNKYKLNFGVYYSPAENLCYTSFKKFVKKYGLIENVTAYRDEKTGELVERGYFTNSIHVPVWVKIDPFKKIDIESELTGYSSAGCITYVELENAKLNEKSVEQILDYAMKKDIPYMAFNITVDNCNECGYVDEDSVFLECGDACPNCGSKNIQKPRRVTGYLTGDYKQTFNKGKQIEVKDREKHTKYLNKFNLTQWKMKKND